jgi:hypothetical protein
MKTKQATHTPGPWEVKFESDPRKEGHGLYRIWNIDDRNYEDQKANARLIAAAPTMFQELQRIARYADKQASLSTEEVTLWAQVRKIALDAIAKATGGK